MRISTIQVDQATAPFDISFHSGRAFRTESESVVLRLGYDNGITSCGESAPRPYVTGETLASVTELIRDRFAPRLLNREIGCLEDVASVLDDLERFCLHESLKPYHSALGAVDVALLDGLGKLRNRPVAFYLGNPSPNPGAAHSVSVPLLPDDKIRELFQRFRHYPFTHLKVLVGDDLTWNVDRLALLRSTWLRFAPMSLASVRSASVRFAPLSLARLKSASMRSASMRSASMRSASMRSALLRRALMRHASVRPAPVRLASLRFA